MLVAWTGHRPDLFLDPALARDTLESAARALADARAHAFLVGGQRGVDTWAALAAIDLQLPFALLLPLPVDEFTRDWQSDDRAALEHTRRHAAHVQVLDGYQRRNAALASGAELLVAVWTGAGAEL